MPENRDEDHREHAHVAVRSERLQEGRESREEHEWNPREDEEREIQRGLDGHGTQRDLEGDAREHAREREGHDERRKCEELGRQEQSVRRGVASTIS
jgi:hypothetical protein